MLTENGVADWDGGSENLLGYQHETLSRFYNVNLFRGTLSQGSFIIHFGYRLVNTGGVVTSKQAIELNVEQRAFDRPQ